MYTAAALLDSGSFVSICILLFYVLLYCCISEHICFLIMPFFIYVHIHYRHRNKPWRSCHGRYIHATQTHALNNLICYLSKIRQFLMSILRAFLQYCLYRITLYLNVDLVILSLLNFKGNSPTSICAAVIGYC